VYHLQAARVGFLAVLGEHSLARHLGQMVGVDEQVGVERRSFKGSSLAAWASAAVMKPFSTMRSMMCSCRDRARRGLLMGLNADGPWADRPASRLRRSSRLSSGLPK
jgi:hypothetical protein